MTKKVRVQTVTKVPLLTAPVFVSGIRDEAAARKWGCENHYFTVYFLASVGRVYADKTSTRVDAAARGIEKQSVRLVQDAERGGTFEENAVLMALVVTFVIVIGYFINWPW